jgi:hypothetical protein
MGVLKHKNFLKKNLHRIQCISLVFGFCFFGVPGGISGNALYSQDVQGDEPVTKSDADSSLETPVDSATGSISKKLETDTEKKTEVAQPVTSNTNHSAQGKVNEQYRWAPEDPSFLYETRNIPDHKNKQEFLPAELEKVEVKERIQDEVNFRKSLDKIKIRLPDMTQTLILVSIIIVVLVYRSRARKQYGLRK